MMDMLSSTEPFSKPKELLPNVLSSLQLPPEIIQMVQQLIAIDPNNRASCLGLRDQVSMMYKERDLPEVRVSETDQQPHLQSIFDLARTMSTSKQRLFCDHAMKYLQELMQQGNQEPGAGAKPSVLQSDTISPLPSIGLPNCKSLNGIQLNGLLGDKSGNAWVFAARITIPNICTNLNIAVKFIMNFATHNSASVSKHLSVNNCYPLPL
jgi:hypothetical protein